MLQAVESFTETKPANSVIGQIAHELCQPLSTMESIAYYLDLILPLEETQARQQLRRLQQLVEQTQWILSNGVHLSKALPAQASLTETEEIDLAALILDVAEEFALEPTTIQLSLSEELPLVKMDSREARQLIANLLGFFRQVGSVEHPVYVCGLAISDSVVLEVVSDAPAGTLAGLNLSVASARRTVESHGGAVTVSSNPNEGIFLSISLPAA